jgi:hypothetical protein
MISFNCQMGRGRTTTGMCVAALIAAIEHGTADDQDEDDEEEENEQDEADLNSDEVQYMKGQLGFPRGCDAPKADRIGEYKTILQLVTVLTHGKRQFSVLD